MLKDDGAYSRGIRKKEESLDQSSNPRCRDETGKVRKQLEKRKKVKMRDS
ncbi:hypothetical protein NST67_16290 [Bacillus sp. FSL W7-1321]